MDMRFGTWNVRSMYREGSLRTVGKEISKYKLQLVGVQDVRTLPPSMSRMSENVGASTSRNPKGLHGLYGDNFTLPYRMSGKYTFFSAKGNKNHELGTGF
jgi:hypothetical protein